MADRCIVKDTPDGDVCKEPRYSTVTIAYTFSFPDEGTFVFDMAMCEGHTNALKHRVEIDLGSFALVEDEAKGPIDASGKGR